MPRPRLCRLLPAIFLFAFLSSPGTAAETAPAAPLELRVMTFNLRYASLQTPNAWPARRPVMRHLLERESPDIIGTQEGLYAQLRDLAADLPAYEWIGLGRAGGSRDEHCAIFFRRDRFEPVGFDHFWLSDTPNVIGSITWGHTYIRMVTWVRLREKATGREFLVWNTHFDHQVETARQKAATLLKERIKAADAAVPLLLIGDFNCVAGRSPAYDILTKEAGLTDTWTAAAKRTNETLNSFHNYQPALTNRERIDWILARGPSDVTDTGIVTYHEGSQHPSDHFPVTATVRF
jgi:endonuclease/exonuclease/phosphatase family metal-dependent hydrolase